MRVTFATVFFGITGNPALGDVKEGIERALKGTTLKIGGITHVVLEPSVRSIGYISSPADEPQPDPLDETKGRA
jgi:ethanolamine utilization microcompartment shell protein EutL